MNYDYEKAYEESIERLYRASINLKETGYIHIVGENDAIFTEYEQAVEDFNKAQENFFGDTLAS